MRTRPMDDGTYTSKRGVEVTVRRVPQPDCPYSSQAIEVRYGKGYSPGRAVWFPDAPRCWAKAGQILDFFLEDKTSLGSPIVAATEAQNKALASRRSGRSRRSPSTPTQAPVGLLGGDARTQMPGVVHVGREAGGLR